MKKIKEIELINPLEELCSSIKKLVLNKEYKKCEDILYKAMEEYPHAPHPHNLLGIVLEKTGNHILAMKHFRAAWALDPTYRPANHNLEIYGTFFNYGECAFAESDIPKSKTNKFSAEVSDYGKHNRINKIQ